MPGKKYQESECGMLSHQEERSTWESPENKLSIEELPTKCNRGSFRIPGYRWGAWTWKSGKMLSDISNHDVDPAQTAPPVAASVIESNIGNWAVFLTGKGP